MNPTHPVPDRIIISPSILSADPLNLASELADVEKAGADWHHIDVMDGHFVPNLTFGLPMVAALKAGTTVPLDVHLMITNPDQTACDYAKAGASYVSFHPETSYHPVRLLQALRDLGCKGGIALNPGTPVGIVEPLLPYLDLVLIMSVNPGFSGQTFLESSVGRVQAVAKMISEHRLDNQIVIEVDGGINAKTAQKIIAAGARALVAGHAVYRSGPRAAAIQALREDRRGG